MRLAGRAMTAIKKFVLIIVTIKVFAIRQLTNAIVTLALWGMTVRLKNVPTIVLVMEFANAVTVTATKVLRVATARINLAQR